MACACKRGSSSSRAGRAITRSISPVHNGTRRIIRRELK